MGGKAGFNAHTKDIASFVAGIPAEHKATFTSLRALIKKLVPESVECLKWGTLAYDLDGSLFALSAAKKHVNFYILAIGVLPKHKKELAGIPQSNCCLRFAPGVKPPVAALRRVMKAAIAVKNS